MYIYIYVYIGAARAKRDGATLASAGPLARRYLNRALKKPPH